MNGMLQDARFENRNCPICQSNDDESVLEIAAGSFNRQIQQIEKACIAKCKKCGFQYTNPVLNPELDEDQYTNEKSGYNKRKIVSIDDIYWTDQQLAAAVIRKMSRNREDRILDFACGKGGLVHLLSEHGFKPKGIDLNEKGIDVGREMGVQNIHCSNLFEEPDAFYDIVSALHVFEHCKECVPIAGKLNSVLREKGHLVVAVPNFGSLSFRKSPEKYWSSPYAHMNAFDINALDRLFTSVGFKRVWLRGNDMQVGFKNWLSMLMTKWLGNIFSFYPTKLIVVYQKS